MVPVIYIILSAMFVAVTSYLFSLIGASSLAENIPMLGGLVYMMILFDLFLSAGRYSIGTTIHQGHLFPFPLSLRSRMSFLLLDQTLNLKSVIFFGFALTVVLYLFSVSIPVGLTAAVLLLIFFFLMNVWIVFIFLACGKAFRKYKALYPLLMIVGLLPIYLSLLGVMDSLQFARFCTSGVTGFVGNGIGHALDGKWWMVGAIVFQMIALTAVGYGIAYVLLRKKECAAYFE